MPRWNVAPRASDEPLARYRAPRRAQISRARCAPCCATCCTKPRPTIPSSFRDSNSGRDHHPHRVAFTAPLPALDLELADAGRAFTAAAARYRPARHRDGRSPSLSLLGLRAARRRLKRQYRTSAHGDRDTARIVPRDPSHLPPQSGKPGATALRASPVLARGAGARRAGGSGSVAVGAFEDAWRTRASSSPRSNGLAR